MIIARGQSFSNSLATRGEKTVPRISLHLFKNENMPRWNSILKWRLFQESEQEK